MTQSVLAVFEDSAEHLSVQVNQAADNEQMLILANRLLELGNRTGVQITITIPPQALKPPRDAKPKPAPDVPEEDGYSIVNDKRENFVWLQTFLTQYPDQLARLGGHYVAVYNKRIISIGCSKETVRGGAADSLKVSPHSILVLPVQVTGPDSDDEWQQVQIDLGIN
ncbi:MAG: hypothetical protein A3E37_00930 [Candidatus Andersenbacteria bacterium RIFCSPHIGHO2_12_FULL_46_9]|nr:MAG: hypothetical protein UW94_C0015G0012 [Parcubacteria group bacterium GW2011_GWA2_45_14]OGY33350.1 MAG: hypothetical protein A3B76_02385 [Candidatus Andersenbacteria bacterium RIFCSPHIGHO2_02_FULL_46_16]OGY35597.1 MAG: hypothetical protein A3E37_00930 [Candidatus Andersenbacteria bacterium RIFCSPHIGHO2_12_FULL_46_9]OGY36449.1 MAG: hypothetical protein A3I08_01385 [Candidatus Andersenbacteria bacterium RIFCSPLOWO2_02_FULL_46_11]OGY38510.1 MAG: hypothetical protein A3G57_00430 [Candidatus A